jgi:hypothetical protein
MSGPSLIRSPAFWMKPKVIPGRGASRCQFVAIQMGL